MLEFRKPHNIREFQYYYIKEFGPLGVQSSHDCI